jgi:cytochrome c-type biogenesis protein CcmF
MLKMWNASLVLATGTLCILGTFLVRSGILDSIHAFGASTLGVPFISLIAVMIAGSVWLVYSRRDSLRTEHRLDSLLSREAVFVANNIVLVGLAFVVFWGTFFPLISEALTGERKTVGPPWFDRYTVPLTLMLVLLSGIGPVIAWRRATWKNARRAFAVPVGAFVITAAACLAAGLGDSLPSVIMFAGAAFVLGTVAQEFWRGIGARHAMAGERPPKALVQLVRRNRRRYGGYIVHVGMALLFVGVAASSAFQDERDVRMKVGDTTRIGDYTVTYERGKADIETRDGRLENIVIGARLKVTKDGKTFTARTERRYFPSTSPQFGPVGRFFEGEATSEIALKAGLFNDFWAAYQPDQESIRKVVDALDKRMANAPPVQQMRSAFLFADLLGQRPPEATFRLISSPLVTWIWLGAIIVFLGGLTALWPARDAATRKARARAAAQVAKDLREPDRELEPV